ncbi:MAG: hypothetical protein AAF192_08490 [Pseudomonadota bacterium]
MTPRIAHDTPPPTDETPEACGRRLESRGAREADMRKALRRGFALSIVEAERVCDALPVARLREMRASFARHARPFRAGANRCLTLSLSATGSEAPALIDQVRVGEAR